jgi:hypothetical protein
VQGSLGRLLHKGGKGWGQPYISGDQEVKRAPWDPLGSRCPLTALVGSLLR